MFVQKEEKMKTIEIFAKLIVIAMGLFIAWKLIEWMFENGVIL